MLYVPTKLQIADIFMEGLDEEINDVGLDAMQIEDGLEKERGQIIWAR